MAKWFDLMRPSRGIGKAVLTIGLGLVLAGCTGRGGGWLPPEEDQLFPEQATFGFTVSCEDPSNSGQQNGRLRIQLEYSEHGTNPFLDGPFSIHGEADTLDPVLESAVCIGEEPPPTGQELIFLGVYRPTSSSAGYFPAACDTTGSGSDTPQCRFEVIVRDNDGNRAPSVGDYFSIKLSGSAVVCDDSSQLLGTCSKLAEESIIYSRDGVLGGGEIHVD